MRYRVMFTVVAALVAMLVSATQAQAFLRANVTGYPGAFGSAGYVPNIEGGVCNDPAVYSQVGYTCAFGPNNNKFYYDQIFINGFHATSDAYNVTQSITAYAYLYKWNGSTWVAWRTANMGTCPNVAGAGVQRCNWARLAEDQIGNNCSKGYKSCIPLFNNLQPGNSYNVYLRVIWRNASTNGILGTANYLPVDSSLGAGGPDIGCQRSYAYATGRCVSGYYQGTYYITLK